MPKINVERKGRIATLKSAKLFKWCLALSLFILVLCAALPLWRLFPDIYGKEVVPLHYNIHYGVDWTGMWWQIFVLPISGLGIIFVNSIVTLTLVKQNRMLADVVMVSSVILNAFLFLAMVFVVLVNIIYG